MPHLHQSVIGDVRRQETLTHAVKYMSRWYEGIGGPTALVLLGAVISAIGGFWTSNDQERKNNHIARLNETLVNQQGELIADLRKQLKLQEELRLQSDEIADLNKELKNFVIGGNSFCYLTMASLNSVTNISLLAAVHQGKYHLYDVRARIVDLEKLDELKGKFTVETMKYTDTNISVGDLVPGYSAMLNTINLGTSDTRRFNIFFTARNGGFTQLWRLKKIDSKWLEALRITRTKGRDEEVLLEKIDPKYPRNVDGKMAW
jgi:hypothetical protein